MASAVVTKMKIEDFAAWKTRYDGGEPMRREFKVRGVTVLRDATDASLVTVVTRFDSVADAKAMLASDAWKAAAKAGGVPPLEMAFTEVADEKTY